ncbi:MAG TPA: flagellar basal-body rod protein FlgF [Deltaproteobacteria bacterium]|nr:flagellar basal-body rod protein FlgF [Deltaproteobacteria bacterium]
MTVEFTSGIVSGAVAVERRMEEIAHNLANVDTPGFRREVMALKVVSPTGGMYPQTVEIALRAADLSPGPLKPTGNPLDLAIGSEGFFAVETPQGVRYTRRGSFRIDQEGYLVTDRGYRVLGQGGPIVIEGGQPVINEEGTVMVGDEVVDTLRVVSFADRTRLVAEGDGLFRYDGPEGEIAEVEDPQVKQEFLEGSNVVPVVEMVKLIEVTRIFEAYQRALQTIDDLSRRALEEAAGP